MQKVKRLLLTPKYLILIIVGVAAIAVACIFIFKKKPAREEQPVVAVSPVEMRDVNIYGDYVGRIGAQQYVEVHARVEGYLQKMLFDEGTYVRKGETLFIIDPTVYRANMEKAKAKLNKAQAVEKKARRDLDRIRPLFEQNAASRLDLDNAEAAFEAAKADVIMAQAELVQAQTTLDFTTVRSPISGMVSQRTADIGSLVGPGGKSLLATVVNSDTVRIDFSMTALDYLKSKNRNVNLGQRDEKRRWDPYVTITMADGSEYPFRGLVDFADPKVNPKTGTFSVRAEMPNPDHTLLPGESTRVRVLMDVRENAVVVPIKAIDVQKGGAYVYVVRPDSTVERRYVETGPEVDNSIVIERGLARGESLITEGYHKVRHGMKVVPTVEKADSTAHD